jgi:ABC-type branched-subunit amino acid transport system ATPase component
MQLVNAMSVRRNVALGAECRLVGFNPFRGMISHRERRRIEEATDAALEICGITALADLVAGTLSTGQRRLLELARVLAGKFQLLLLDEPSSGLDEEETERLGKILGRIPVEQNIGILLVEHDMALVMAVCQQIFVLEFGHLIFEGGPSATQSSELVRAAYLGNESIAAKR